METVGAGKFPLQRYVGSNPILTTIKIQGKATFMPRKADCAPYNYFSYHYSQVYPDNSYIKHNRILIAIIIIPTI